MEAVHRVRTDAGRLSSSWLKALHDQGLDDARYMELIGIVATISALDTVDRAVGRSLRSLSKAVDDEPTRHRPAGAGPGLGWLPTLAPGDRTPSDPDWFFRFGACNIQRAMSLVPDEVIGFFDLDCELHFYEWGLPQREAQEAGRASNPAQIEMIAARAAALNGCHY